MKTFSIIEFKKEIKVTCSEEAYGQVVSCGEYRKRKTTTQIELERAKYIALGFTEVKV